MEISYLAITDICNYKCKNCPNKRENKKIMKYEDLKEYIEKSSNKIQGVVLSGGEPTIHPNFFEILEFLNSKEMYVTILSNGSTLFNPSFVNKMKKVFNVSRLNIVMTIYNINERIHDKGTGIKGSFRKTLQAFELLIDSNIKVALKHCISKENYKKLPKFFSYFEKRLPVNIPFQLTTLDFSGMDKEQMKNNYFLYKEVKKYLNKTLKKFNDKRKLSIVNTPFCAVDEEYWKYFVKKQKKAYEGYKSPNSQAQKVRYDCDCFSELCKKCKMYEECPGVYKANYDYIGDSLIEPIIE